METPVQPQQTQQTAPKAPMTAQQLVDLRARVLRGEAVSDEELRHALSSLAMQRGVASTPSATKADPKVAVYQPKGSLAERMAAFKAKSETPGS